MENWIPLNEYANKHQVSISTLRRWIKSSKIEYKLADGKYFLIDDGKSPVQVGDSTVTTPAQGAQAQKALASADSIAMTKLMLDELKRAYRESLQSKEDQILYLKQQVSDLKTLVMLLEKDNNRLKAEGK